MYEHIINTTMGSVYHTDKLINTIKQVLILSDLKNEQFILKKSSVTPVFLQGSDNYQTDIPVLKYPFVVEHGGNDYLIIDIRPFLKKGEKVTLANYNKDKFSNHEGFKLTVLHAIFTQVWLDGKRDSLRLISPIAAFIYTQWIANSLKNRYGLNPLDELKVMAAAYAYYHTPYYNNQIDIDLLALTFKNTFKIPISTVLPIFQNTGRIANLDHLCEVIKGLTDNPQLTSLEVGGLINITSNIWYGYEAKTMLGCALEYPPLWLALITVTLQSSLYSNTRLFSLIKRQARNTDLSTFNKQVDMIINEHTKFKNEGTL